MKNLVNLSLSLILFLVAIFSCTSCKKGEDDPLVSLRSRDARITGDWVLTGMESVDESESAGGSRRYISSFNGTMVTETSIVNGNSDIYHYPLVMTLSISQDGKFTYKIVDDMGTEESQEYWSWTNNTRNKTGINLGAFGTYNILELRNSRMVLTNESFFRRIGASGSSSRNAAKTTLTFEKR
ncbi:hypothetical protein RCC89_01185 [Cytophagaceae bacterium ABcell3]|nr:hypothetical protein RCC89_01185 [Cytophagaceae bacterium ABcell3]